MASAAVLVHHGISFRNANLLAPPEGRKMSFLGLQLPSTTSLLRGKS